ncbi:MAG: SIMPL domain-containing protein [Thermoguttaceae bacterium]
MCSRFVGVVVAMAMAAAAHGQIAVETRGTAVVKPDVAYVGLLVSQRGLEIPKRVQARANQIADKLSKLQGARKCHVSPPTVSVEQPSAGFDGSVPAPKIFRAQRAMLVEASPEGDVAYKLVAAALDSGAEIVGGLYYSPYVHEATGVVYGVTDADEAYARAFADALKNARLMADRLAAQVGLKLGAVKAVEEQGGSARYSWADEFFQLSRGFRLGPFVGPDPEKFEIVVRVKMTFETK